MNILGIGPLEFLLIGVIMLTVLGPKESINTGYRIGRGIRKILRSPAWKTILDTSREIREVPVRLMRESGLQENIDQLRQEAGKIVEPAMDSIATELSVDDRPLCDKGKSEEV